MFTNQPGCTVYARTVGANRMETYTRHYIKDVYWEQAAAQTQEKAQAAGGHKQSYQVFCNIPAASLSDYIPQYGDLICCGFCTLQQPPNDCFLVQTVEQFLYGSPDVQHIEVTAV